MAVRLRNLRSLTDSHFCASPLFSASKSGYKAAPRMTDVSGSVELRGRTAPWGRAASLVLAALVVAGLWLRLRGLSAEGFGDDEVHKWLAANRYLHGIFSGDDVEHPMLMKWLIAASILLGRSFGWAPETMTRLP